ncbi:MAG: hypothetical protein QOG65_3019 [Actinomycetota bacterium]|nr:hypothetical protein [Actinomycetota bacterium]MDQ1385640.1 hypothetical protein [Actinomycetota bacterium]
MRHHRFWKYVRSSLWFVPVVCVLAGATLSVGTIWIDNATDFKLVPQSLTGGPDAAVAILSTVAASMVSLAALVLTITMVVVQLAMGQFSPRIVQTFLRDKPSQIAVGLFVATFVHAMLALREVQFAGAGSVPGLAIVVAYLLVVISVVVLVLYVHHIGRSLRVSALIELVGNDTRKLLDGLYPESLDGPVAQTDRIEAPASGVVNAIDRARLVSLAQESDCMLELMPALGAFVPAGAPLFRVHGDLERLDVEAVTRSVLLGLERTLDEDVAYGMRMLVDMAERSLADSPFLDPTTAVQAIDRLHDCLRQLARRVFPDGIHRDPAGRVRLVVPVMEWDAFVHLAFDEIRLAGAESPQVTRRLTEALNDLETVAPPERLRTLQVQRDLLGKAVGKVVTDKRDAAFALVADRQGIGVTAGAAATLEPST